MDVDAKDRKTEGWNKVINSSCPPHANTLQLRAEIKSVPNPQSRWFVCQSTNISILTADYRAAANTRATPEFTPALFARTIFTVPVTRLKFCPQTNTRLQNMWANTVVATWVDSNNFSVVTSKAACLNKTLRPTLNAHLSQ